MHYIELSPLKKDSKSDLSSFSQVVRVMTKRTLHRCRREVVLEERLRHADEEGGRWYIPTELETNGRFFKFLCFSWKVRYNFTAVWSQLLSSSWSQLRFTLIGRHADMD